MRPGLYSPQVLREETIASTTVTQHSIWHVVCDGRGHGWIDTNTPKTNRSETCEYNAVADKDRTPRSTLPLANISGCGLDLWQTFLPSSFRGPYGDRNQSSALPSIWHALFAVLARMSARYQAYMAAVMASFICQNIRRLVTSARPGNRLSMTSSLHGSWRSSTPSQLLSLSQLAKAIYQSKSDANQESLNYCTKCSHVWLTTPTRGCGYGGTTLTNER